MKRRDIGKLLLIGLAAAGLQGCSQTAETTAADVEKPQVQTEAETDAASETKTAEAHTWQFTYFGTSTNEKSNTMAEGGSLKNGISLTSCTVKEDGSIDKKAENLQQEKAMTAFPFIIQSLTLKQRISV